jgi:TPR repeat protein
MKTKVFVIICLIATVLLVSRTNAQQVPEIVEYSSEMQNKAENGDLHYQYLVGYMYLHGMNVPKDEKKGLNWLKKAGNAKVKPYIPAIMTKAGYFLSKIKKKKNAGLKAVGDLTIASRYGNDKALKYANMLRYGSFGSNYINTIKSGVEREDSSHIYLLGLEYLSGNENELEADKDKAIKLIETAARNNQPHAQYMLARFYYYGNLFEKDLKKAYKLFNKSRKNNNIYAQSYLGWMYVKGKGVEKNYQKGIELLQNAAKCGIASALWDLSIIYAKGLGIDVDYDKSFDYLMKAAHLNSVKAQYSVGLFYEDGKGSIEKDEKKAKKWIKLAADNGYKKAEDHISNKY